jgi:cell division protein FtsB
MTLRKRNHYRNRIGLPVLTAVLVICAALLLAALSVVVNKNRITAMGEQQRQVEQEMKLLNLEIMNLSRRIDQLLDGARVQPLLQAKGTWLQKINPDGRAIIYLKPAAGAASDSVAQNDVSTPTP